MFVSEKPTCKHDGGNDAMMAKLKQLSLLRILLGVRSVWSNCEDSKPIKWKSKTGNQSTLLVCLRKNNMNCNQDIPVISVSRMFKFYIL